MMVSLLIYYSLMIIFQFSAVSAQGFSFSQRATGPSNVCEGSDVTLQCVIVLINTTTVRDNSWSRNISGMVTTINTLSPISNHELVFNPNNGGNDLVITNVTQEDNNAEYICSDTLTTITSSVVFNVTGIPPVENLTAVDSCTNVTVNWDITDGGSCKDLQYNVLLISLGNETILQPMMTNVTSHTFSVDASNASNERFRVNVSALNRNTTGPSRTTIASVNLTNEIPPVENLTAIDNCTHVTVSWDITDEATCKGLSYNVLLTSLDDDVILQSMITNDASHTFSVEPSNELFSVNVSAINETATGPNCTADASVNAPNDIPSPIDLRNVSRICVTFFNISWNASNRTTCGDVSYNVLVCQSSIEQRMEQFTRVGDTFYLSVTGLINSDPDVMVTVTASNKGGQGSENISIILPKSLGAPPINDVTASTTNNVINQDNKVITPSDLSGFDIFIMWTRPMISDLCTTLPVSFYIINASVTFMNGSSTNYVSRRIMDTSGDSMGRFNESYNDNFHDELVPEATYVFTVKADNTQQPPRDSPVTGPTLFPVVVIVIIVVCIIMVISISSGIAYLHVKSKLENDDYAGNKTGNKTVICMWVLFIASLGLGFIFLGIYLCCRRYYCRKRKDVLPDTVEMTGDKQGDLYASPKKINQEDTDNKAAQELYSYATTGPINVVVPGGKP